MENETLEQQTKDSDMIFNQIINEDFKSNGEAIRAIISFYIPDETISRSGINHAMDRLEKFYEEKK